ncbi:hypothetical protein LSCM1_07317 [Leishmania martiniquensis]|uniref:Clp1 P-loop domain-containing protein n=1 Tax=Leishmania martiniquensis TaxID=1580590 RepID=A0A836HHA0_9TRYP|nr:hypothetical protein LSCM1_07317 [Leishmania martiniquensis]
MPTKWSKRIVDARPQSVADGVGSVPLSMPLAALAEEETATTMPALLAATTASAAVKARGRRVTVSGVEEVRETAPAEGSTGGALLSSAEPFKVPDAVRQRIQQLRQSATATHASSTEASTCAAAPTSEEAKGARAPVSLPPASSSACDSVRSCSGAATAPSSFTAASRAPPRSPPDSIEAVSQLAFTAPQALPTSTEEIGEGPMSATAVAHKASRSKCVRVEEEEAPLLLPRQKKPVIFSRQWRRQLFTGTVPLPLPVSPSKPTAGPTVDDLVRGHRQSLNRGAHRGMDGTDADIVSDEEVDADEDGASPFGKANVIKFSCIQGGDSGPQRRAPAPSSGDSSEGEDQLSTTSLSVMRATAHGALDGRRRGVALQFSGAPTRRQQHQLRKQEQEAREHHRVELHMSGFDAAYLSRQEARLRVDRKRDRSEGSKDEESGDEHSSEDEEADDSVSDTGESASLSSVSGAGANFEEEEQEEGGDSDDGLSGLSASAPDESPRVVGDGERSAAQRTEEEPRLRAQGKSGAAAASEVIAEYGSSANSTSSRFLFFQSFFFACHENRMNRNGCHHTLLGLRDSVTIKGPCGVIGFGLGEVTVSGFYLGCKQLALWHEEHRAVLMPMKRLKTRHAQDMELPQWPRVPAPAWPPRSSSRAAAAGAGMATGDDALGQPLNPLHYRGTCDAAGRRKSVMASGAPATSTAATEGPDTDDEEEFLQALQWNCESVFGDVDWDWVEATLQSWRGLFSSQLPPILLIVQPPSSMRRHGDEGPTRRFYLTRKRGRGAKADQVGATPQSTAAAPSRAYMDIPSFVAHRSEPSVDLALVPSIVPSIAAQGCGSVMVLGSANIGKSTLCRYLVNVLLSQHGLCYWLDLDVGQPEFGVPGQMALCIVRRPLLRAHDASCAQVVSAFFVGASAAAQCPLTTANALAALCAQARAVGKDHPVVVNTHGWVLQTGRRISVEALRRLRPRHVIHLHRAEEALWAQDTAALLNPRNGLNAEVVQRRFLVRRSSGCAAATTAAAGNHGEATARSKKRVKGEPSRCSAPSATLLCHLPYPHTHDDAAQQPASAGREPHVSPATTDAQKWCGQVHSVRVQREETYSSIARIKATKGSRGRQLRWETYFAALLRHYAGGTKSASGKEEEAETTLLEAPLSALHSIVLAERDEKLGDVCLAEPMTSSSSAPQVPSPVTAAAQRQRRQTRAEVAAALEHAVVAVLFHALPSAAARGQFSVGKRRGVVRSLASLPNGFPVSCYGVVESCERELLHGAGAAQRDHGASSASSDPASAGWIRIRVPLRRSVVAAMLSTPESELECEATKWSTSVSIAYSAALRGDTAFVDVWR